MSEELPWVIVDTVKLLDPEIPGGEYCMVPKDQAKELWFHKKGIVQWQQAAMDLEKEITRLRETDEVTSKELDHCRETAINLKQENDVLRKALEIYVDQENYYNGEITASQPWLIAREVLKK